MNEALVSIIIPNYNHASFLNKRIESVLAQSYQNYELILLDDCSTDNSWDILKSYNKHPRLTGLLRNKNNSGSPFKQWKKGIGLAKGKYVWIAESDDWAQPDFLATLIPLLEQGHGLAYCRSDEIDEIGEVFRDFFWADGLDPDRWRQDYVNIGYNEVRDYLLYRCTIPNASACVFRRELAPLRCGFDKMKYCGDWLFWIRLLETCSLAYVSKTLNHFRHHPSSTRRKKSEKEEYRKRLEIISTIEYARKSAGLALPEESEYAKYDWVQKGFYKQLLVPEGIKHKLIFYVNRYYPGLYSRYQKLKGRDFKNADK